MPTSIPFLRIEKELPSQITLVSPNNRWIILIAALLFSAPMLCIGGVVFVDQETRLFGVVGFFLGLLVLVLMLFFAPYKSLISIDTSMRMLVLHRYHWLGETIRERAWAFNDISEVNLVNQDWKHIVEVKSDRKKVLLLDFGGKAQDARRTHIVAQSWLKGFAPDSDVATLALQEIADKKQTQQALKNAEKMLYYFGGFSLLGALLGFFADNALTSAISVATIISLVTGIIYLACGFGAKQKLEAALWVAIVVVLVERLYWFIMSGSLSGDGNWSSWLTWVFAIFVVSSLWQAIRSIRNMQENPVYEPLA